MIVSKWIVASTLALGSIALANPPAQDLEGQLQQANAVINAIPDLNEADIAFDLKQTYDVVYSLQTTAYNHDEIAQHGQALLNEVFNLRMKLRNQIPVLIQQGKASRRVLGEIQDLFRVARYAEDLIGEVMTGSVKIKKVKTSYTALMTGGMDTLLPAGTSTYEFKSGDVLLVRGTRYNSAAIARVADVATQFSHAAMIYIDPQGKKWVMEALIEDGLDLHTLDSVLNEGLGRAVLLRYQDADIAARAAKVMYDRAYGAKTKQIEYDFSMDMNGYDRLFCSKVVRNGFDIATNGQVMVPMFPSHLGMKNRDFFDAIGVTVTDTFAPGDLELDPRFKVIAEWRDYRLTTNMRIKDMILMKIFEWMEKENMHFVAPPVLKDAASIVKWGVTHSQFIDKEVTKMIGKIPAYMKKETISEMVMLQLTADPLEKRLIKMEKDFEKENGVPMHPRQMLDALEQVRRDHPRSIMFLKAI